MTSPKISIVIPAYNEADNIKKGAIKEVKNYLKSQSFSFEVLIVDDGSTDNTVKLVKKEIKSSKNFKIVKEPHRGKAGTVIAGMLKSKGDIVLFTDMDQATPLSEIEKFFPKFSEGYDIVIGSRQGRKGAPFVRKAMAFGFTILRTVILRLPYKDTQCGFKAFNKNASSKIFKRLKVYNDSKISKGSAVNAGFDLEVLYIARKLGLKVAEVPVDWQHKGTIRVNPVKDSLLGLKDLLTVRMNAISGKYKI